uniref:HIT domain-containing protein n=1 Tax=candidate division WOR-3 bacterium TaxID=2052148 RepID=A0A7V3VTW6_UNCW3
MDKLWAPWRMEYIRNPNKECFLCAALRSKIPEEVFILEKMELGFTIMNRYPYNNGHLLIAPIRHIGSVELLNDDEIVCIHRLLTRAIIAINQTMRPDGFNIGINQGRVAGAGLVDHLHYHLVPRWLGDTNFMPVLTDTKVISEDLNKTYKQIKQGLEKLDNL